MLDKPKGSTPMSKKNLVWVLDFDNEEDYTKKLAEIRTLTKDENNIRIILADTDFYLSKCPIIEKIFGRNNSLLIIDIDNTDKKNTLGTKIRVWMEKKGYSTYETLT